MAKVSFTAGKVAAFKCPADAKQAFLWDSNAKGLGLRLASNGKPAYIFQGEYQGKAARITIGSPDAWSIPEAQAKAREFQRLIDEGVDPRTPKRQALAAAFAEKEQAKDRQKKELSAAVTFEQVWAHYMDDRRPYWSARSYADHADMIKAGGMRRKRGAGLTVAAPLAGFLKLHLKDLTAEIIEAWAQKEAKTRRTRAQLAKRLLRAHFNWCKEQPEYASLLPEQNPTSTRRTNEALGKPEAKQDALLKEQLSAWFDAVQKLRNNTASAYLQCLLLTGARPNELMQLRWDDINTQWQSLTLRDKDESKGGRDGKRIIPFTPYAQHLIERLPKRSQWVFSSEVLNQPISRPTRLLADACSVAGIEHLTLHGLRRSFGSLAEWLDLPAGVIAQIQGHKPSATAEKHYRVRPLDLLRVHHEKLEAFVLEQAGVQFDPKTPVGVLKLIKIA